MNALFLPQRFGTLAIYGPQFPVESAPPIVSVALAAGPATVQANYSQGGSLALALVLIDEPAPHSRCIFMDYQNRAIRL